MNTNDREKLWGWIHARSAVRSIEPEENACVITFADGAQLRIGAAPSVVHDTGLTYTTRQWREETFTPD